MSTCHGFWSVGTIGGGVIGAAFASAAIPTQWHLLIVIVVAFPIAAAVPIALPEGGAGLARGTSAAALALPSLEHDGLCAFRLRRGDGRKRRRGWGVSTCAT